MSYTTGTAYTTIATNLANARTSYPISLPGYAGQICTLKVEDVSDASIFDTVQIVVTSAPTALTAKYRGGPYDGFSMNHSSKLLRPEIGLVYPQPTDTVIIGDTITIRWTCKDIANLALLYSVDSLKTWKPITNIQAVEKAYTWRVQAAPLHYFHLKLVNTADTTVYLHSEKIFVRDQVLSLPESPGIAYEGTVWPIRWDAIGVLAVNVYYSSDSSNWIAIANNVPAQRRSLNWSIPKGVLNRVYFKVVDVANPAMVAISTDPVTITPLAISNPYKYKGSSYDGAVMSSSNRGKIRYLLPQPGATILAGASLDITWLSNDVDSVDIFRSLNNGISWDTIFRKLPAVLRKATWVVEDTVTDGCMLKIASAQDADIYAIIPGSLSIRKRSLAMSADRVPDYIFEKQAIGIKVNSFGVDSIQLFYSVDNKLSWNSATVMTSAKVSTLNWNTPVNAGAVVYLMVRSTGSPVLTDTLDKVVKVLAAPSSDLSKYTGGIFDGFAGRSNITRLFLKSPTGGEVLTSGNTFEVKWSSVNLEDSVKIQLSLDSGKTWQTVDRMPAIAGTYEWTIPSKISGTRTTAARLLGEINNKCLLRVIAEEADNVISVTQQNFTIRTSENIPSLIILKPTIDDTLQTGVSYPIKWDAQNIGSSLIAIDVSDDDGATWTTIAANLTNTGNYDWQVPLKYGNTTGIRYAKSRIRIYATIEGTKLSAESAPFVWKQQLLTGIPEEVTRKLDMKIYPNPATDFVMVHAFFSEKQNLVITITDGAGRKIYERGYLNVKDTFHERVPLKGAAGMVYVTVSTPQGKICTIPVMMAR
ncbi:hypothetical protein [Chitinophaga jiangningensis]|uniref:hypothetical protein n=1 Tax=Chitinophaga jiangningensis TaxID=1419482 RepID=UPI00116035D3|nr:hypothetical protein [Chitinophaga jiangningensis]